MRSDSVVAKANWMRTRIPTFGVAVMAALLLGLFSPAEPAHAGTTFTVNTTADPQDRLVGCDATECTLREAINAANAATGPDTIDFNIPSGDPGCDPFTKVCTIAPTSALPNVTGQVTIDGYSQPGARPNSLKTGNDAVLRIELSGIFASPADGLRITGSNVVVKGLVINRFTASFRCGISIRASGNQVEGNLIGTDPTGTVYLGNAIGVHLADNASNNTVGGTTPGARNLISGNVAHGVLISGSNLGADNRVQNNYIGTDKKGTGALSNGANGVSIGASNSIVGGVDPGAANTIAFNGDDGVSVSSNGVGNRILSNSIFSNGGLGINLYKVFQSPDGVTPNDVGDGDTGNNNLQNFPELTSARSSRSGTTVKGTLNSIPGQAFTVQLFLSRVADPSGNGEGQRFIGEKVVTTGASGNASFTFKTRKKAPEGQVVTATATSSSGDTSEFSKARKVARR